MIQDSGNRRTFETGAVRDIQEGKGRCDLMPIAVLAQIMNDDVLCFISMFAKQNRTNYLYSALREFCYHISNYEYMETMMLDVSKHFEEGAKKYGPDNWQKGIPVNCYLDSAIRHYLKFRRGDTDEPHDRAFVWNIMCCIWEVDYHGK